MPVSLVWPPACELHRTDPIRPLGVTGPGLVQLTGGVPDDRDGHARLVVEMMLLQEIANRLQLGSHRLLGGIELDQRPAVAPPPDHHEHRGHRAHAATREDERPRQDDPEVAQEERVERQEPDRERGEGAAGRLHRTGRRRAGSTMNGALGTAPSALSVLDSSVTAAPRNLTT